MKKNEEVDLDCYLRSQNGKSESQIGYFYHWKRKRDEYGKLRCSTARRHIQKGKKIFEKKGMLREKVFGIKYKAPVRVRRRKKPIDK